MPHLAAVVLRMGCEGQERRQGGQLSRQQRRYGEGMGEEEETRMTPGFLQRLWGWGTIRKRGCRRRLR